MTPLTAQELILAAIQMMMNVRTELILTNMLLALLLVLEVSKIVVPWVRQHYKAE